MVRIFILVCVCVQSVCFASVWSWRRPNLYERACVCLRVLTNESSSKQQKLVADRYGRALGVHKLFHVNECFQVSLNKT